MQNAVTCCESPRLSPLVRDKGVARWRTPFGAGISFCFCVESEITIITMITVTIIGREKSHTLAGVYILQFAVFRFNKWQEMFNRDTGILFQKLWEVTWHDLKQKKNKDSVWSPTVRMCVGRISLYPTHVVLKENAGGGVTSWWFSICWQLSSPLRVCFGTISSPVARTG